MKKNFVIIGLVLLIMLFFINKKYNLIGFIQYKRKLQKITYFVKDISLVKDGIYEGEYDTILIRAKVKVIVKDKKIIEIDLEEYHHDRGEGAEVIVDNIVKNQMVDIDTIAGVTNSSKVIKKAVDNALLKGRN